MLIHLINTLWKPHKTEIQSFQKNQEIYTGKDLKVFMH